MLSVHQQRQHHAGILGHNVVSQSHRANVIVSTNVNGGTLSSQESTLGTNNNNIIINNNINNNNNKMHGCKRAKIYAQGTPYGTVPHQPASVARRNARERNRVKQVNNGFATLRQHIPQSVAQALGGNTAGTGGGSRAGSKKLSKVETLRMAVEYIRSLQRILGQNDETESTISNSSNNSSDLSINDSEDRTSRDVRLAVAAAAADLRSRGTEIQRHLGQNEHHRHPGSRCGGATGGGGGGGGGAGGEDGCSSVNSGASEGTRGGGGGGHSSFVPAPCSEASSSPTPSFVSEASSGGGSQGYGTATGTLYGQRSDNYDNYEPMSPEDEELLDVISWWQQSQ